ncbi:MAG: DNA-3-methyladenine glycosylase 2 family protein [Hyphomicrobiales bacterium]|nr:DNA-3-methyladenine glycosylase 2 family protein [Hyphomicrobiales bacterium]
MRTIDTEADIAEGLTALAAADPRLAPVIETAGPIRVRRRSPGFEGLAAIVVAQQLSTASADAIWGRLTVAIDPFTAENFAVTPVESLSAAGLSRQKIRTLSAAAEAVCCTELDFAAIAKAKDDDAGAMLTALPGIGPWTAEIYLLFCAGHPDIFPAGDLALQEAVRVAYGLDARPGDRELRAIAEQWSPWRGVAARLLWAYYAVLQGGRDVIPV